MDSIVLNERTLSGSWHITKKTPGANDFRKRLEFKKIKINKIIFLFTDSRVTGLLEVKQLKNTFE